MVTLSNWFDVFFNMVVLILWVRKITKLQIQQSWGPKKAIHAMYTSDQRSYLYLGQKEAICGQWPPYLFVGKGHNILVVTMRVFAAGGRHFNL